MIEHKDIFMTNDGKYFNTPKEAEAYIENYVQEEINEILKKADLDYYRDLFKAVNALAGDLSKIRKLYEMLHGMLFGKYQTTEGDYDD